MNQASHILAIDQGTTGTTALLVSSSLQVIARANCPFEQHYPKAGWVEHCPEQLWASVVGAIDKVLAGHDLRAKPIAAIGLTNQRETCLIWERASLAPVGRAIVWQDRRTQAACQQRLDAGEQDQIHEKTGLYLDPYFSATKLAWLCEHGALSNAQLRSGAYAAGTVDSFLLAKLTGGKAHATEPSNASRTMLWNLRSRAGRDDWDPDLIEQFGLPRELLPEVLPSDSCFGTTLKVPGLPDGIPIHGILGDQQAALLGQLCLEPGQAKCTYGTGAFVLAQSGPRFALSAHKLLTSVAWQRKDAISYCLEGSAFLAGALVSFCKEGLGIIDDSSQIEALAASVESSDGVVVIPAHAGLGAPHWRPKARGMIAGMTRKTRPAHIARAALEGIACSVQELLNAMNADLATPLTQLRVDGGAAANNLLLQTQSDLAQLPLLRPSSLESTGLGAAMIAGLGCGLWPDLEALQASWSLDRRIEPGAEPALAKAREVLSRYQRYVTLA